MLKLGRPRGVLGELTGHTQRFRRTLAGFGLTWNQKIHFSTFDCKLESQCTRNDPQNLPFCQGISMTPLLFIPRCITNIVPKHIFPKKQILIIENPTIAKSPKIRHCYSAPRV